MPGCRTPAGTRASQRWSRPPSRPATPLPDQGAGGARTVLVAGVMDGTPAQVARAVQSILKSGRSVRAEQSAPEGLRVRQTLRLGRCLGRCFAWRQGNASLAHHSRAFARWQGIGKALGCRQQALAGRQRRTWARLGTAAAGLLLSCRLAPLRPLVRLLLAGGRFRAARLHQMRKAGAAHGAGSGAVAVRGQSPKVTLTLAGSVASMVTMRGMMRAGGGTGLSVVRSRLEPSAE